MGKLVTKTIPGLFNGVSQQATTMRLDTQGEMQENALGTIVDGLYKRPNTESVALFASGNTDGAFSHEIDRDLNEQYIMFITSNSSAPIVIYRIDGTACTVRYGQLSSTLVYTADASVKDYLVTTDPLPKSYKAITIADYTLIVNRTKVSAMSANVQPGTITDKVQTFLDLPDSWDDVLSYSAEKLYTKGNLAKGADRKVYYYINDADGTGKPLTDTLYWRVEYVYCAEGEIYEVSGDVSNEFDNYYVKFTGGVWAETLAPGSQYKLNEKTMPHRLVRTGTNEFTLAPCLWEDRVVGDTTSCPIPSFIGKKITNLTFFKNRLGLLASDTFCLSRAGRYFELFGETAMDLLDDDPIDVLASSTRVVSLVSSIPFDKNLLINSEQGQFSFGSSGTTLTPTTASITPTTTYVTDKDSDPVGAGANVYFVNPREKYVSIMEYLIQPDTLAEDAADITAHCPHYIPSGTLKLMSCIPMNMLLVFTTGDRSSIYVYKYYWVGNEKPQSAWSRWTFNGEIVGAGLIGTSAYITIKRNGQVFLERIRLENIAPNSDFDFRIHLDRQVRVQGVYSGASGLTTWILPYTPAGTDAIKCINPNTGLPVPKITIAGNIVTTVGDKSLGLYVFGEEYEMRYRMSEWYVKDQNKVAVIDGKLQIRTLVLSYKNTGEFHVDITPANRETLRHTFTGIKVGTSKVGNAVLLSGEERFTVLAKSKNTIIDIVSTSYLPCQIVSGAFEGFYVIRSERV